MLKGLNQHTFAVLQDSIGEKLRLKVPSQIGMPLEAKGDLHSLHQPWSSEDGRQTALTAF